MVLIVGHAADQLAGLAVEQIAEQQERGRFDAPDVLVSRQIVAALDAEARQVREAIRGDAVFGQFVGQVPSNSHGTKIGEILRLDNSQARPYYQSDIKRSLTMANTDKKDWMFPGAEVSYCDRLGRRDDVVILEVGDGSCYVERENGDCLWVPMNALREGLS